MAAGCYYTWECCLMLYLRVLPDAIPEGALSPTPCHWLASNYSVSHKSHLRLFTSSGLQLWDQSSATVQSGRVPSGPGTVMGQISPFLPLHHAKSHMYIHVTQKGRGGCDGMSKSACVHAEVSTVCFRLTLTASQPRMAASEKETASSR